MPRAEAKQPVAFRLRPRTVEGLKRRARDVGQPQTALAERYIDEGIRTDEHPLITFRDGAAGRRPALAGTRLDVAQVIETMRANDGSVEAAATYLDLPATHVRACVRYYSAYQDEVDAWIERTRSIAERAEAASRA